MRFIKLLSAVFIALTMSSCTQVIFNNSDEIRLNSWSAAQKGGNYVSLKFVEDNAEFKILSENKKPKLTIKGLCLIDKNNIMIFDNSDKQSYTFSYTLKDNKLKLRYDNGELTLKRSER